MLPPPKHPEVTKLRRSLVINRHNDTRVNNLRCQAAELIFENQWNCTVEFVLGISSEVKQFGELKNTSPPAAVEPVIIEIPVSASVKVIPAETHQKELCRNCQTEIDYTDLSRRKTLKPTEKYCSPACKAKYYRKN